MVWYVQPVEKRDETGAKLGKWRLVASSDEGGGTHGLCAHDHDSPEEARDCPDAIRNEGMVTGIPRVGPRPTVSDLAAIAYNAYRESVDGKSFHGEPLQEFEAAPDQIRAAWEAAVSAVKHRIEFI